MHIGSLVTALASYLDARANAGTWLVRIEDLDTTRTVPGASDEILHTLDRLGMHPDEPVLFQSQRAAAYQDALQLLSSSGHSYECSCTRRELAGAAENVAGDGVVYPGHCRAAPRHDGATAIRLRTHAEIVTFEDALRGRQHLPLVRLGDPVIRRRDGIVAYQLAVVVDDAWQRISSVVRGDDLLLSTAWQILLQRALGLATPLYRHLPLVVESDRSKLAKSRHSLPLRALQPGPALLRALSLLRQSPPATLKNAPVPELLEWAIANWRPGALQGIRLLAVDSHL